MDITDINIIKHIYKWNVDVQGEISLKKIFISLKSVYLRRQMPFEKIFHKLISWVPLVNIKCHCYIARVFRNYQRLNMVKSRKVKYELLMKRLNTETTIEKRSERLTISSH